MEIADWLTKEKMSLRRLAEIAKISPSTLYSAFANKRSLSGPASIRISKATGGQVSSLEASWHDRKPFKDDRKKLKKKKICCPHCGEIVPTPRWVKQ